MKTSDQAGLPGIRALIRDDAFACSHQTLGQYRTALLQAIDRAVLAQQVKPGVWMHPWPPVQAQQDKPTGKQDLQVAPAQEPVAWLIDYEDGEREVRFVAGTRGIQRTPLYTAPPCCHREGAGCTPPALLRTARHLLESIDAALPHAPHCGEFDALADAAADLTAALAEAQASMAAGQSSDPVGTPRDTTRLTSDRVAVVDEAVEWRPISYCPPRRKVLLLTDGGVAVLGTWDGVSTWAIAWAPLPVIPAWLRQRLAPVAVRAEQDVTLGVYRHEL